MNILGIDLWMPTPNRDTASQRVMQILLLLQKEANAITFAGDDVSSHGRSSVDQLQKEGISVLHTQFDGPIEAYLEQYGHEFDLVILSRLEVGKKYIDRVRDFAPQALIIYDTTDIHFLRRFRRAKVTGNIGMLKAAIEAKQEELQIVRKAHCTWVVSNEEKRVLEKECPEAMIERLSIIQEVQEYVPAFTDRSDLLFIGAFPFHPNPDAMEYYYNEIRPLLASNLPGVKTTVVGSSPPPWLLDRNGPDFRVTGFVPDLRPYLEQCRLTIAPLRFGAGVKGKVILSLSYGVPVVASSVGAEGIPAMEGQGIMVADNPHDFSNKIATLYHDEVLWKTISQNGRAIVRKHFSLENARDAIRRTFQGLGVG